MSHDDLAIDAQDVCAAYGPHVALDGLSLAVPRGEVLGLLGPNGAGKSTFYELHVSASGLHFINADLIARDLGIDAYAAAGVAASTRERLFERRESFVFETVFSDPAGDKLDFLRRAANASYNVILCFIGVSSPEISEDRVAVRLLGGGHDVPPGKLQARYPRTLQNLKPALADLPSVWVFDNDDFDRPYRLVAIYENGAQNRLTPPVPAWLKPLRRARHRTAKGGARRSRRGSSSRPA